VLGLAALLPLLAAAFMAFAGLLVGHQAAPPELPHFAILLILAVGIFDAILAVWAILTVIGIVRLRLWARYSILIIGGSIGTMRPTRASRRTCSRA
jgi:hypothetical protein